ncbi:MAG: hypothetical protein IT383_24840 [Deltaproteobacteria bacterium]|nr:hypothetical protein [Deltaproteobacteria bacterium]
MAELSGVSIDAIISLQDKRRRLSALASVPGREFDEVDHAIDLVLDDPRLNTDSRTLADAASANARRVIRRRRSSRPLLAVEDAPPLVDHSPTPEALAVASQMHQKAAARLRLLPGGSREVFQQLLEGYSVDETAAALAITPLRTKYLRVLSRAELQLWWQTEAA